MPGPTTVPSLGPPNDPWTVMLSYTAVPGNNDYTGYARPVQNSYAFTVTSVSTAGAAVITSTAHGLQSDQGVVIAGGTGDWAGLNGTWKITVTGVDTFTVPVNSSGYSGTFAGTITTTAPRTNATIWAISKNYFDGSNQLTRSAWAGGGTGTAFAWDSRTSYRYI